MGYSRAGGATPYPLILNLLKDGVFPGRQGYPPPAHPELVEGWGYHRAGKATTHPLILNLLRDGATTGPACGIRLARPSGLPETGCGPGRSG